MKIVSKSSNSISQLEDRNNKGFKHIEIQLMQEFLKKDLNINLYCKNLLNKKWNIYSIHMPLVPGGEDVNFEYLSWPEYEKVFNNCCHLAQKCAEYYGHTITIIIHSSFNLKILKLTPILFDFLINLLNNNIKKYPNITFSFENVLPINLKDDYVMCQNVCFAENVELVNYLKGICIKPVFYTTLDICHLLCTLKIMDNFKNEEKYNIFKFSLDYYFKNNKNTINNIHLNNIRNYGMSKMEHGASFDLNNESDRRMLKEILRLYDKYKFNCPLTLEVDELNYDNAINAYNLKELLIKIRG